MTTKYLLGALALCISTAAFAAEPAPALKKVCCCKDKDGKMACCKDKAGKSGDDHAGHDMSGMDQK